MTEETEKKKTGGRFANVPDHMKDDLDVPAFLRNRKNAQIDTPFEIDEDVEATVDLYDVPNRHFAEQMQNLAAQTQTVSVEDAVRAPIRSQYSKKMFSIIEDATKRLDAVEKRKQILREEIEEAQNELASLTTESDLLRDTIDRFKSNALDDDPDNLDVDGASPTTRRRAKKKTASGKKSATARRKAPKTFLKETADDNSVSADEKS